MRRAGYNSIIKALFAGMAGTSLVVNIVNIHKILHNNAEIPPRIVLENVKIESSSLSLMREAGSELRPRGVGGEIVQEPKKKSAQASMKAATTATQVRMVEKASTAAKTDVLAVSAPSSSSTQQLSFQIEEVKPNNLSRKAYFDQHIVDLGGPMCIGTHRAIIFVADEDHEATLRCNFIDAQCAANYSFPAKMVSALNLLPKKIRKEFKEEILFWREDSRTYSSLLEATNVRLTELPPPSPVINGTGLILDTGVGAYQFGHTMNMYIPLIILLETGELNFASHLVDFLYIPKEENKRWSSEVINSLVKDIILKSPLAKEKSNPSSSSFLLRKPELNAAPLQATCFANLAKIRSPERYFESPNDAELFQNVLRRVYPSFKPRKDSCPPQKAIVLYRSGAGQGLRQILNYHEVEEALLENGIESYTNVTLSQETPIEEALEHFSSAGLIITTHSSTLKMLAFAHPGTVVVEVRHHEAVKYPYVFHKGPDVMGVHYLTQCTHKAKYDSCIQSNCKEKSYIYADLFVNKTELSAAITQGLEEQGKRCPAWGESKLAAKRTA